MTNDLKNRAKRLRVAIKDTLDVSITMAQSLELVAIEENYPNWDAATASFPKQPESQKTKNISPPKDPRVVYVQGLTKSIWDRRDVQRRLLVMVAGTDQIVLIGGDSESLVWLQELGYPAKVVPTGTIPPKGARWLSIEPSKPSWVQGPILRDPDAGNPTNEAAFAAALAIIHGCEGSALQALPTSNSISDDQTSENQIGKAILTDLKSIAPAIYPESRAGGQTGL